MHDFRLIKRLVICSVLLILILFPAFQIPARASLGTPNDNPSPLPGSNSAIISNGTIQLGVRDEGHLNVAGGTLSAGSSGTTVVGLRYLPTNGEATAPGCLCEGWGVADGITRVAGYANVATDGGVRNMSLERFSATASTAESVVRVGSTMRVTHSFFPSPLTPNLYQVDVTVQNISTAPIDLLYRRVMDWDIQPNTFNEYVTIQGFGKTANLIATTNDGFASANPLAPRFRSITGSQQRTGNFRDAGPYDHGALFDFGFGMLDAGQSRQFTIFYGAAGTEYDALLALSNVGTEVYSLAQPDIGQISGEPNTYIFGFAGVNDGQPSVLGTTTEPSSNPLFGNDRIFYSSRESVSSPNPIVREVIVPIARNFGGYGGRPERFIVSVMARSNT
ncbi:MAG: hypothetical protein EOM24_18950, partial [Chloroflexia bacterium]|nr:hypothetical protein [Chloroflexia bacterium]